MPDIACINGKPMALDEARVPVSDRGFLFGDGVYEVVRTYGGLPFLLDAHLDRLDTSLGAIRLTPDWDREILANWIAASLMQAGYAEAKIYIQVTRGVAPREHAFPDTTTPTTLITVTPLTPLDSGLIANGVTAITTPDIRWKRCDIKSLNLLPNVLARQLATEAGAFEALFVTDEGLVSEGAGCNLFMVKNGALVTPGLSSRILAGVSRAHLLKTALNLGIEAHQRDITLSELLAADEVFFTGTTIEVVGVSRIDQTTIGSGAPGPVTRQLAAAFRPAHATALGGG
ncbi:MAG: aminotransferase class IV [Leptospirillia bacterium]